MHSNGQIRDCTRRIMVGLHMPDYDQITNFAQLQRQYGLCDILAHIDPREMAREIKKAHIQAFWFYSKCHFGNAYYPSKVGHIHSALKGRDLFGELCEACRSEGIVPGAVYEFSDLRMPHDHPDWCHRIPDHPGFGKVDVTDALQGARVSGACLNGPYGEFVLEQLAEVLKQYPIQGYWLDFLGLFGFDKWICPYCNPKFKKIFGRDFPGTANLSHAEYVRYIQWRLAENDAYCRRVRKLIKQLRPDVAFTHNFHGFWGPADMQWFDTAERNCDFMTADFFQLRDGLAQVSWKTRILAAGSRQLPAETLLDPVGGIQRDGLTPKALDSYRVELWTARAVNVTTCVGMMMNLDGTFDRSVMALNERVMREHIEYEPWLRDMEPLATVGLVRSSRSLAFRPKEPDGTVTEGSHHQHDLEGWTQVLIAAHQLWDMVDESHLDADHLKRFKVLILPNVSCLDRRQVAALTAFVRAGGTLVATGDTSLFDGQGRPRKDFQLMPVFGVRFKAERQSEDIHLIVEDSDLKPAAEPWVSPILRMTDGQLTVQPKTGAHVLGTIGQQAKGIHLINLVFPAGAPGLLRHRFGQGECWYFAGKPGLQFRRYGQTNVKRLMKTILEQAAGRTPPVRLEAPDTVELFAHRQKGQAHLVVNLVHAVWGVTRSAGGFVDLEGKRGPTRMDEAETMPPLHEVRLFFRNQRARKVRNVYLAPTREKLPIKTVGNEVVVTLKNVGAHTMVVAEYG